MAAMRRSKPSLPPTRAMALASSLSAFADWELAVHCPTCSALRIVLIDDLIARHGSAQLLGNVVPWLRCRGCGTAPDLVRLFSGMPGPTGPITEVDLVHREAPVKQTSG